MFPRSRLSVLGSMSTNAGCASTHSAQLALATNESGEVATVSPLPIPVAQRLACNATVPFAKATACAAPVVEHSAASNRSTAGPWVNQSPRNTSTTAAMSSSSTDWRPYGMSIPVMRELQATVDVEHRAEVVDRQPLVVRVARVHEVVVAGLADRARSHLVPPRVLGHHEVHVAGVDRVARFVGGDQQLVQLLAGPDADHVVGRSGRDGLGEVGRPASTGSSG